MFRSLQLLNLEVIHEGFLATFNIQDTCFQQTVSIIIPTSGPEFYEPVAIIKVYSNRKLNVVRNLSIYYASITKGTSNKYVCKLLAADRAYLDRWFSSINFGKIYYPLLKISNILQK